jgi:catechol 2,3-dioxygenase-like lactoylglutathione lyase family enzyme
MSTKDRRDGQTSLAYGAIGVSDIEHSLWFYCDVLGFRLVGSSPLGNAIGGRRPRAFHLACSGGGIDLLTMGNHDAASDWLWDDRQVGVRHVGMKVASVDDWAQRLHSVGAPFRVEPVDAVGNVRLAFFEDPDGANLEIVQGHISYSKVWDSSLVAKEQGIGFPAPTTVRFDHVAVSTTNLDATIAFYEQSFGFQVIGQLFYDDDPRGLTITMLRAGGAKLEVFTFTTPVKSCPWAPDADFAGLRHLGIETGDVDRATDQALTAGAIVVAAATSPAARPRAMLTDPDGIPVELVTSA